MKLFTTTALTLFLSTVVALPATAKTPSEIMTPYKAYAAAMKSGDTAKAAKQARIAWEQAERLLGDERMTGDLAANYGNLDAGESALKSQIEAIERSMELASFHGEDAANFYMERGLRRLTLLSRAGKNSAVKVGARKLAGYAEANDMSNSTLYAEALTVRAGQEAREGNHKKTRELTTKALDVFEAASDGIATAYPLQANLYRGYADEADEDFLSAALSYQKVMEATDGLDPNEYEIVSETLGRWIYMRGALHMNGELEAAENAGLCECWPYEKDRNEDVKPVERFPPAMPRKAMQSGYVVVEFDLEDDGSTTNPRVVTSWPDYYEKSALKSLSRWKYTPRSTVDTDDDRSDLLTTISFRLSDERGNIIW